MPTRLTKDEEKKLMVHVGHALRAARERLSLTQREAAQMVGMATEVYGKYERGQIFPSVPMLYALCTVLQVEANILLGLKAPEPSAEPSKERPVETLARGLQDTKHIRRLLGAVPAVPRRGVWLLSHMADQLARSKP